jgi:hypothetical protein
MDEKRWSIYIDVEGFAATYSRDPSKALLALGGLMGALFHVGSRVFSHSPDRLFIHQFGDGFVVVSNFPEANPERPLALCIAVMRHLLARGIATKAAISAGDFSDVFSCYPKEVQELAEDHHYLPMGEGLMTIIPVMGSALISPYKMAGQRSGAVLLFDPVPFCGVPAAVKFTSTAPIVVDWIHTDLPLARQICEIAGLTWIDSVSAANHLRKYVDGASCLPESWVSSTLNSVGLGDAVL